jgi:glycosyltransferase involved in cell wall biosynthesis
MKPLKVCIFTETYAPVIGGGETQAQLLAEGLISQEHSAIILTRRSDPAFKRFEMVGTVPVYRIPPSGGGQLKKWGLVLSSILPLIRLQKQYDLLFVSGFRIIGISAVLIGKLFGKKIILKADSQGEMSGDFFINGLEKFRLSRNFLPFSIFLKLRNFILKKADGFSAISEDIITELISGGVPPNKIHKIPNSVDTHRFLPVDQEQKTMLRKQLGLPETHTIAVYTGRLVSYKGLPLLLEVWKDIQNQHKNVLLLMVGTGGLDIHNCEADLREYVKSNRLEQTVHFTGSVRNVPDYLQASDIYAFPTQNDAFPSSLIEAMTCGLGVISTPVGAIKNIIKDQENGMMVPSGDGSALFKALDTLIRSKALGVRMGQAAWKTVQNHYSAEVVTNNYLTLFQETLR